MVRISIASLIYQSRRYADWVHDSVYEFTPLVRTGEAEFYFVANDATDVLLEHLQRKGYKHFVNTNSNRTEAELFSLGYGAPTYMHRVYRGYNKAIELASGEIVVLINSDHYFSPDWLENLLKYLSSKTIVCSQLVERRHPEHGIYPGAYRGEFGSHPDNFKREDFLHFVGAHKVTGVSEGGAYMPCAFYKYAVFRAGLFPEGNLAGRSYNQVRLFGDEALFKRLDKIGVKHVTALDSIVYHLKEGEIDEPDYIEMLTESNDGSPSGVGTGQTASVHLPPLLPIKISYDGTNQYLALRRSLKLRLRARYRRFRLLISLTLKAWLPESAYLALCSVRRAVSRR